MSREEQGRSEKVKGKDGGQKMGKEIYNRTTLNSGSQDGDNERDERAKTDSN